jgi:hypothetical protein
MKKSRSFLGAFLGLVLLLCGLQTGSPVSPRKSLAVGNFPGGVALTPRHSPGQSSGVRAATDFGRMPLYFIANEGQLDPQVAYYVRGKDKTLYFTPSGLTMVLGGPKDTKPAGPEGPGPQRWVVKLNFVGADEKVRPVGEGDAGAVISYFRGKPEEWHTGVPTYARLVYRDLWPGIDLVYSGTANRLKYEFVVRPGADPSAIRLAYQGVSEIAVDKDGALEVSTPRGSFRDDVPAAYQEIDGQRCAVPLAYRLAEKEPAAGYQFAVGEYNKTRTLVLDPAVLVYCGFVGGSGDDYGYGIDVDTSGNVYIAGQTASSEATFPVTAGPDLSFNSGTDAFIAKVNARGTGLVYCGYIGGSGDDHGRDVAVDSAGNAYFTGYTDSTESTFPVTVGPDLTHNLAVDAFVGKLNPSGTALIYCGYIGGWGFDYGMSIDVDGSGDAYVAGYNNSSNFPVTVGPDLTNNGGFDAFVAKVNPSGTGLLYCGYIGGDQDDEATGIAVDGSGNAYVTGFAMSTESTFPVTVGPDTTYNGGSYDAFVAKVSATGDTLVYCGYIGGSVYDKGFGIAVDGSGDAYITGQTNSTAATFPVAVGPDTTPNGNEDAFVAKVNPSGTALLFCGYIGGSLDDYGQGIALDSSGNIYVAGYTNSAQSTFPVLVGPGLIKKSQSEAFVARLNPAGTRLSYCGYIGGTGADRAWDIAADAAGNAYLTGETMSSESTFPVIAGPDLTANGSTDAFVAKVLYFDERVAKHAVGDFDGDGADELAADFGVNGTWEWNGGVWTQISASNPEGMTVAEYDGDPAAEIFVDFGATGLWLFNNSVWTQVSPVNVETMAAGDVDGDGRDELVCDFGTAGLWLLDGGSWTQLSGADADYVITADIDADGAKEVIGDFGTLGMWKWEPNAWTQLSGVNPDFMTSGNLDANAGADILGDFGAVGLWLRNSVGWFIESSVNAEYVIAADVQGIAEEEIVGDFGSTGLWLWTAGTWSELSGLNAEYMIKANTDGDAKYEIAVDFGAIGLWLWNGGTWTQLSGVNPEYMVAGDFDGDSQDEILADFGPLGVWQWKAGVWTQVSPNNPD